MMPVRRREPPECISGPVCTRYISRRAKSNAGAASNGLASQTLAGPARDLHVLTSKGRRIRSSLSTTSLRSIAGNTCCPTCLMRSSIRIQGSKLEKHSQFCVMRHGANLMRITGRDCRLFFGKTSPRSENRGSTIARRTGP